MAAGQCRDEGAMMLVDVPTEPGEACLPTEGAKEPAKVLTKPVRGCSTLDCHLHLC